MDTKSATENVVFSGISGPYTVTVTRVRTVWAVGTLPIVSWEMEAFSAGESQPFVAINCATKRKALEYASLGPRFW